MTDQTHPAADSSARTPLWEFVPANDYAVPTAHVQKAAAEGRRSVQQLFQRKDVADTPFKDEQVLQSLPRIRLADLVPPLPWEDAAAALDVALQEWIAAGVSEKSVKFFIGQPFSGHVKIVSLLGITLQAFTADRLQCLFYGLMSPDRRPRSIAITQKNGQEITGGSAEEEQRQKEFVELAAHCRGNIAIATTYWRARLRYRPDEEYSSCCTP